MPHDKIDVHAHYIPDLYRDALVTAGQAQPDGIPGLPEWNEEMALAAMDTLGVRLAILSISSPGVHFGDAAAAASLARAVNETGAKIARAKPSRFGFFAAVPLPEIDAAVTETRYSLDHLGADGISLLTNHRGIYLGDERLEPIFAEVEARKSVVFVHPPGNLQVVPTWRRLCSSSYSRPPAPSPTSCCRESCGDSLTCGSLFRMPARRCLCWPAASTCSPRYWLRSGTSPMRRGCGKH